jgi:LemA protein
MFTAAQHQHTMTSIPRLTSNVYLRSLLILFIPFALSSCGYNTMVTKREAVDQAASQVQNVYQRRADLIPNLVNTVKGEARFEQQTLTDVIEARAGATKVSLNVDNLNEENLKKFEEAQGRLSSTLSRLLAVSENYPTLQANAGFRELRTQLEGTENRITTERMKFNQTVQDYNTTILTFPNNLMAGSFGFEKKAYFAAKAGAENVPEVKFE